MTLPDGPEEFSVAEFFWIFGGLKIKIGDGKDLVSEFWEDFRARIYPKRIKPEAKIIEIKKVLKMTIIRIRMTTKT